MEMTPRQKEILALKGKGWTNPRIAEKLGIKTNTVKYHLTQVYKALGVTRRGPVWAPLKSRS